ILDEVLAVGDAGFRAKSFNKMKEIMKSAAVIFVSHAMPQVARTCDQVLFMRHGKSYYQGDNVNEGISLYFDEFKNEEGTIELDTGANINNVKINDQEVANKSDFVTVSYGGDLSIDLDIHIKDNSVKDYYMQIQIIDKDLKIVAVYFSNLENPSFQGIERSKLRFLFSNIQLVDGEYGVSFLVFKGDGGNSSTKNGTLCIYRNYCKFKVKGLNTSLYAPIHLRGAIFQNDSQL
ncbi:MAG TPA: hypothetical protein VKZ95_08305, partial [Sphingobacteriaceae bacterium]|nr:hypothetical protein [Sphingobacteriaceae bacterium]